MNGEEAQDRRRPVVVALLAAVVVLVLFLVLTSGGDDYEITAEFQNASQLVIGNKAVVGGRPVGTVEEITLAEDGQALVRLSIDEEYAPLRRGTVATIRWTSLSSIAQRQVQLTPPAEGTEAEAIPHGGTLTKSETVSEVDIDQLFNTLDRRTVKDFKRVIQGFARSYEGVAQRANRGYKYLNPLLYNSRRVFAELNSDQKALEDLLIDGSRFAGALADRSTDVSQLVGNLNRMMNAIGDRKTELARAIGLLPDFLRNANTTFVNLRAALDDVQPFVVASRPVAQELLPFLIELRATARNAVPTVRDLVGIVRRPGKANDLTELQRLQVPLRRIAVGSGSPDCGPGSENPEDLQIPADDDFTQGSFGEALCSLHNGHANLTFFRAYVPELVGWFDGFSHSGYADAMGGIGRVAATFNTFSPTTGPLPDFASPDSPLEQLSLMSTHNIRRCPGANERPLGVADPTDDSVPFTDDGHLTDGIPGDCDPTKVQPGP